MSPKTCFVVLVFFSVFAVVILLHKIPFLLSLFTFNHYHDSLSAPASRHQPTN